MTPAQSARAEAERIIDTMDADWSNAVEIVAAALLRARAEGMREAAEIASKFGVPIGGRVTHELAYAMQQIEHRARELLPPTQEGKDG